VITFLSKIPIKALSRSRKQVENRSPLSHRILMGGTLGGMLMVEILFFWVGLYIILGIQHPQVIINKNQFSISHIEGIIMECIIPMANYFLFIPTRNAIKKQISLGQYYDKVEEFEFAFPLIWMTLILSLIGVAVYNISDP
ncbi:MAG TPA: hypothetical protein VJR22_00320, partial [Candidatus Nitrosotalea sp.]|nr:hypothetical protein [Candidatus Nitrosotalea sp.]